MRLRGADLHDRAVVIEADLPSAGRGQDRQRTRGRSTSSTSSDTSESSGGTTTDGELAPCAPECLAGDCPDIVNVKTLGALGDGQTDDIQALRDIAAYATDHPGVTLVYPEGTYRIDRYVTMKGFEIAGNVQLMTAIRSYTKGCPTAP